MKKAYRIIGIVLCSIILVTSVVSIFLWSGMLSKELDNDDTIYRVLQITDIHLRNDKRDNRVYETIDKMIKEANPDLIVVTGDLSSNKDNESDFRNFAKFIEAYNIEWTFTFGNHDAEGDWTKTEISDFLESLQNCTYQKGFAVEKKENDIYSHESLGNYYKTIKNANGDEVLALFMLDSNMYLKDETRNIDGYANFRDEQIEWYRKTVENELTDDSGKVLNSIAFFHIPMVEYRIAYKQGEKLIGHKYEDIYCSQLDDNMFETMVELGSTKACLVGHDHMNSFVSVYNGIKLGYGYSADHTIYFVPQKGGNIINIKSDGSFTMQGLYRNFGKGELIVTKTY